MAPRSKRVTCLFCEARVSLVPIPPVDDDSAWERIAAAHHPRCSWAVSRAGRLWNYEAPADEPSAGSASDA